MLPWGPGLTRKALSFQKLDGYAFLELHALGSKLHTEGLE